MATDFRLMYSVYDSIFRQSIVHIRDDTRVLGYAHKTDIGPQQLLKYQYI